MAKYVAQTKPRGKPGPKPKDGKHKSDTAMELRKRRLTLGQIAKEIYGDPKHRNKAAALLTLAKKKQAKK